MFGLNLGRLGEVTLDELLDMAPPPEPEPGDGLLDFSNADQSGLLALFEDI